MICRDLTTPPPEPRGGRPDATGACKVPRNSGSRAQAILGVQGLAEGHHVAGPLLSTGILALTLVAMAHTAMAQDAPVPTPTPAEDALRVFESKCAECHGPTVRKPKGGFGYVTDLEKLSSDPALVVRGAPDKSEVFLRLVSADPKERMPPSKAKAGSLTQEQIAHVRRWIESGAPPLPSPGTAPSTFGGTRGSDGHPHGEASSDAGRLLRWLGKFHPVIVHFPIALLLCAALAEVLRTAMKREGLDSVVTFCVVTGAGSAALAAVLGWLAADAESTSGGTLLVHRWLGVAVAFASLGAAAWRLVALKRSVVPGLGFRLLLVATGVVSAVAGHFGAMLVHGKDHFTW